LGIVGGGQVPLLLRDEALNLIDLETLAGEVPHLMT
jgi:hypothetical protein